MPHSTHFLKMCRKLECDQIYITHAKADYGSTGEVVGQKANWHNWGDFLHQVIETKRVEKKGNDYLSCNIA